MMKFEKVSFNQYCKDIGGDYNLKQEHCELKQEYLKQEYNDIKIPQRATKFSAGYDFFMPFSCELKPNETLKIPTGIRWVTTYNYRFVQITPRSGLGNKYQLGICGTVGNIDADYYKSANEGHIFVKIVNRGDMTVALNKGDAFVQGIIMEYQRVDDDNVTTSRNGGFGSSDSKKN